MLLQTTQGTCTVIPRRDLRCTGISHCPLCHRQAKHNRLLPLLSRIQHQSDTPVCCSWSSSSMSNRPDSCRLMCSVQQQASSVGHLRVNRATHAHSRLQQMALYTSDPNPVLMLNTSSWRATSPYLIQCDIDLRVMITVCLCVHAIIDRNTCFPRRFTAPESRPPPPPKERPRVQMTQAAPQATSHITGERESVVVSLSVVAEVSLILCELKQAPNASQWMRVC